MTQMLRRNRVTVSILVSLLGAVFLSSSATAETIWIPASQAEGVSGALVFGQQTGVLEEGALGDFLVSSFRVFIFSCLSCFREIESNKIIYASSGTAPGRGGFAVAK